MPDNWNMIKYIVECYTTSKNAAIEAQFVDNRKKAYNIINIKKLKYWIQSNSTFALKMHIHL